MFFKKKIVLLLLLSLQHRASRVPDVAFRRFRVVVSILAIAVATYFQHNLVALSSSDLLYRSTRNKTEQPSETPPLWH
jgi:hypothetical protein